MRYISILFFLILSLVNNSCNAKNDIGYEKTVKVTTYSVSMDSILIEKLDQTVIPWLISENHNCRDFLIVISMVSDVALVITAMPYNKLTYMEINQSIMGLTNLNGYTVVLYGKSIVRFIKRKNKVSRMFKLYNTDYYLSDENAEWMYWVENRTLKDFLIPHSVQP